MTKYEKTIGETVKMSDAEKIAVKCPNCQDSLHVNKGNGLFVCPTCNKYFITRKATRYVKAKQKAPEVSGAATPVKKKEKALKVSSTSAAMKKKTKDLIFCLLLIAVPMIQFCIFYLGVNINSFAMVFQEWVETDPVTGAGHYALVDNLFENFKGMFTYIKEGEGGFWIAMKNSGISFLVITLIGISFSLIFSLYIFKKGFGSGMFRILLFAPSILSAAVTVTMYKYFVTGFSERIWGVGNGLLDRSTATEFGTILFYNVWISFGTQVLMYSGAMNGIDPSVIEAAKLDGANPFREFFSIILPLIFPTIQTFLVTGIAALFVNQINLVAFSGLTADMKVKTVGYYLFTEGEFAMDIPDRMPILATFGVLLTLIAAPITLLSKWALDKFGPSVE